MTESEPRVREFMTYDVVVVGGGPAGLCAAIRLKQLARADGKDISVCLIDKGRAIGAHILSGAILDPISLSDMLPDWQLYAPSASPVTEEYFCYLTHRHALRLPSFTLPPQMHNKGCFILSLGELCQGLAAHAEHLGIEIYPGFAATDILYGDHGEVTGIITGDMGREKNGRPGAMFTPGIELRSRYLLLAEGAHGYLSEQVIARYALRAGCEEQRYGLGLKELWEVPASQHRKGLTMHTMGWPLADTIGGGLFLYHYGENLCAFGLVLHLNYRDPYTTPFDTLQRAKQHPTLRHFFDGARRIGYGARVISEGGLQSVPELAFPGGALIGCAAGFMNVPRIKGIHNAITSAKLAAQDAYLALNNGRRGDVLKKYSKGWRGSAIGQDLEPACNVKPLWTRFGTRVGAVLSGIDLWCRQLTGKSPLGTLPHGKPDHFMDSAKRHIPPPPLLPDGNLTFDKMSSLYLSGINHREDQPVHLKMHDPSIPLGRNKAIYDEPAERYCPAGVYEIISAANGSRFQINAANCLHCQCCTIKDPSHNLRWTPPEGGSGPDYGKM